MSDETKLSALEENVSRKGSNAYYYAHSKKIDGPAWDGREEPRLIAKAALDFTPKELIKSLDSFSWLDDDKVVKIFVDQEGASDVPDDEISLVSSSCLFVLELAFCI
jgi:hypothetical protein